MNSPWAIGLGLLVLLGTCRCRAAKFSLAGSPKYCHELHKCVLMDIELLVHVFRRPVSPRKASSARHVLFKDESPPPPPPFAPAVLALPHWRLLHRFCFLERFFWARAGGKYSEPM